MAQRYAEYIVVIYIYIYLFHDLFNCGFSLTSDVHQREGGLMTSRWFLWNLLVATRPQRAGWMKSLQILLATWQIWLSLAA